MVSANNPKICERCGSESITQDKLVFDTYFLSAIWPFAVLDWGEQSMDFKHFYPSSLMVAARNMIFRQAARMIMLGIHVCKDIPFREILISARIWNYLEKEEKTVKAKVSNSEPLKDIISEYGADTLRFALAALAVPRQDVILTKDRLKGFKAFINKVWNASRFVLGSMEENDAFSWENINLDFDHITDVDRWILNSLNNTVVKVNDLVDAYRLHKAANLISHFFRCEYCNWYLEFSKIDKENNFNTAKILKFTLSRLLQLMHPFIPFITEEINHKLNPGQNLFLAQTSFPVFSSDLAFPGEFAEIEMLKKIIKEARRTRTENRINPKSKIEFFLKTDSVKEKKILVKNLLYFDKMVGSSGTQIVNDFSYLPRGFKGTCPNWEILIPLNDDEQKSNVLADLAGEVANLDNRIMHLEDKLSGSDMDDTGSKDLIPGIMALKRNLRACLNRRDKIRKAINDLS
jgi:valyl-tRNA synthetase